MSDDVQRQFGYALELENGEAIDERGMDCDVLLAKMQNLEPTFSPYAEPWLMRQDQGSMGSCQGHALSHAFQICCTQKFGVQVVFSRMAAYIMSQRSDGIHGDRGSTLNGGMHAASGGLPLENEWPYPRRYSTRMPNNMDSLMNFRLQGSKRLTDVDLIWEMLKASCVIQIGVTWNDSFEHKVADRYRRGRSPGGHSTIMFGLDEETGNAHHFNSWHNWLGNGRSQFTKEFVKGILRNDRTAVFVSHDAAGMEVPDDLYERAKAQGGE